MPSMRLERAMDERDDGGIRCSEVLASLSDFVDGDLPPSTVKAIEVHLASCINCSRFGAEFGEMLVQMRRTLLEGRNEEKSETHEDFANRLVEAARAQLADSS